MKKLFLSAAILFALAPAKAQLSDWQNQHNKQIMFFTTYLGPSLSEGDGQAVKEIELGQQFWYRAYMDDKSLPKSTDGKLDLRLSCEGVSVTLNDMCIYAKDNFASSNGILPNYDQIEIPGVSSNWKNKNVYSNMAFSEPGQFDKYSSYGCQNNWQFTESLLRFLLSKIDSKVLPGAVLNIKFELVYRTKGEYRMPGATYEPVVEGTVNLKIPAKEKALNNQIYRLVEVPGMADKVLDEGIKKGILTLAQTVVADVYKVQVVSNSYNIDKNNYGTPLSRWVQARVIYKGKATGETFTGLVNVVFNYDGSNYDQNASKVYFQCGNTFAPSFAIK